MQALPSQCACTGGAPLELSEEPVPVLAGDVEVEVAVLLEQEMFDGILKSSTSVKSAHYEGTIYN